MKIKECKECFGNYENWDNSWHCKGCIVSQECKEYQEEIELCQDQAKVSTT